MLAILVLSTVLALMLSVALTPLVRNLAFRWNLVDQPDNKRKVHTRAVPRVGGVALAAAYCLSLLLTLLLVNYRLPDLAARFGPVRSIAFPALIIFLIGLLDDILNLKPRQKFAVQFVASGLVVFNGVHLHGIPLLNTHPVFESIASMVWLVACTNAINLIDGLDGLASGMAFLATLTIFGASVASGNAGLMLATAPLAAALLGFLIFNFNPASIFLGDSGSLLLGFLVGCYSIMWNETASTVLQMAAPLMALAVPLLDTTLAISRRFLRKQPIFKADRSHIHHQLLARGLSHRRTVLLLYCAACIGGSLALSLAWAQDIWVSIVLALFATAVVFGIKSLAYAEFGALLKILSTLGIRHEISNQLAVQSFAQHLQAANTADECWLVVKGHCSELGFDATRMQLAGREFHSEQLEEIPHRWAMEIPIAEQDFITISPRADSPVDTSALVLFATTTRQVLTDKKQRGVLLEDRNGVFSPGLYGPAASARV
jgi:UDP-GlcNAc:undecaprenyl-phosphate GlcNAc-1-phosphate transferase